MKTSTPRSRILATNWSCSYCARSTQSTSSKSSSSWLDGVSRWRLSSGRWTITLRSLPTSEWTPNVAIIPPFPRRSLGDHLGPRVAVHDCLDLVQAADRGAAAGGFDEPDRRLDLGAHRSGGERQLAQLAQCDPPEL